MSSLSLSQDSGSVEVWKCGKEEICLPCLNLSNNSGSVKVCVEMWKYVFLAFI